MGLLRDRLLFWTLPVCERLPQLLEYGEANAPFVNLRESSLVGGAA